MKLKRSEIGGMKDFEGTLRWRERKFHWQSLGERNFGGKLERNFAFSF